MKKRDLKLLLFWALLGTPYCCFANNSEQRMAEPNWIASTSTHPEFCLNNSQKEALLIAADKGDMNAMRKLLLNYGTVDCHENPALQDYWLRRAAMAGDDKSQADLAEDFANQVINNKQQDRSYKIERDKWQFWANKLIKNQNAQAYLKETIHHLEAKDPELKLE